MRVLGGVALVALHACGDGIGLAHDVTLDTIPTNLTFAAPVASPSGRFSLCLEFRRPGDSRDVGRMIVALHDSTGVADTLRGAPDRVGEGAICLHDSTSRQYVGATITAPRRVILRELEWRAPVK